jgi:hypothetical protein
MLSKDPLTGFNTDMATPHLTLHTSLLLSCYTYFISKLAPCSTMNQRHKSKRVGIQMEINPRLIVCASLPPVYANTTSVRGTLRLCFDWHRKGTACTTSNTGMGLTRHSHVATDVQCVYRYALPSFSHSDNEAVVRENISVLRTTMFFSADCKKSAG